MQTPHHTQKKLNFYFFNPITTQYKKKPHTHITKIFLLCFLFLCSFILSSCTIETIFFPEKTKQFSPHPLYGQTPSSEKSPCAIQHITKQQLIDITPPENIISKNLLPLYGNILDPSVTRIEGSYTNEHSTGNFIIKEHWDQSSEWSYVLDRSKNEIAPGTNQLEIVVFKGIEKSMLKFSFQYQEEEQNIAFERKK